MSEEKPKSGIDSEKMKSQLDRLLKNTVDGIEELKEVLVRASQNAKVKLDATFLRRERDRLFQQLGEETYLLIEDGGLKTPAALRDTVDRIHAIVEQLAEEEAALDAEVVSDEEAEEEPEKAPKKARSKRKAKKKAGDA